MKPILTITLNPSIDASVVADEVHPTHKIRTTKQHTDPGGGGLNVARVVSKLGGAAVALYLAGGVTGEALDRMIDGIGIERRTIRIEEPTRVSFTVYEKSTGHEFRFVPEGPEVAAVEEEALLEQLQRCDADYVVVSGSLPRGLPHDFYVEVAAISRRLGARLVIDTAGPPLSEALEEGVFLVKPNLRELQALTGTSLNSEEDQLLAAAELIRNGSAEVVAVTLGAEGALLVSAEGSLRLRPPTVEAVSTVGAGDSFVGAMTLGLARGEDVESAFALGVAAGTAAIMTPGTELCRAEDVERLYGEIRVHGLRRGSTYRG